MQRFCHVLVGVCLALLMTAGTASAATASAATTSATIFEAFTATGAPAIAVTHVGSGSCFSGSIAINRNDAWRCTVGNDLYDPCFSSKQAVGKVLCPTAFLTRGIEIDLTKSLPHHYANTQAPSLGDPPWDIETASGRFYLYAAGATAAVDGKRANYGCVSAGCSGWLWGSPDRRVNAWWTITYAPLSAKHLTQSAAISRVWM